MTIVNTSNENLVEDKQKAIRPQQKRRQWLKLSFIIMVVIPVILGTFYYTFWASDRYVSGAGFAIRQMGNSSGGDALGMISGLVSTGSTSSDSHIILKYLKSRDLVEKLNQELDLRAIFANKKVDFFSRLSSDAPIEEVTEYWNKRILTSFDANAGIVTFEVDAFTAEDAWRISSLVLSSVDSLVNQLSHNARKDAVQFAEMEVARAEGRLQENLQALRLFREQEKEINPTITAQLQVEQLSILEKQLLSIRARIRTLENSNIDANSPALRELHRQALALQHQISEINQSGTGKSAHLSDLLATYESLEIERDFAQRAYASSLISLETARTEADRQQRYLATYSVPAPAEDPLYPRRIVNIILLIFGSIIIWGISALLAYSVRDHLS